MEGSAMKILRDGCQQTHTARKVNQLRNCGQEPARSGSAGDVQTDNETYPRSQWDQMIHRQEHLPKHQLQLAGLE